MFHYQSLLGAHQVGKYPVKQRRTRPELNLVPFFYSTQDPLRYIWQKLPRCQKIYKGTSLSRLASAVLWTTSTVPWSGDPAGDGWSNCFKHFFGGSEPLRTATIPGGGWERNSLDIAVPWTTAGGRGNVTISWGYWGETGTVCWGVYRSSPVGRALRCPGLIASGSFGRSVFIENDSPRIHHLPRGLWPGALPPFLSFSLRRGKSGNAPFLDFSVRGARTRLGLIPPISPTLNTTREKLSKCRRLFLSLLKPVDDWVYSVEIGASSRKNLSFSLIWDRVNHKCLCVATRAAIDRPIALAVSLVALSGKSVALRSSTISSFFISSPSSISLSRSAWYACNNSIVCKQPPAWPAALYALPTKAEEVWRGLVGNTGVLREDAPPNER